ncbi:hypothetical protein E3N88_44809 [Mikania micrantha]|uniref:FAD dependent oxidoreductase domain-containing protein n=1 Tax=Mikania micrantha TaxID=192012 RepID=A0A5N6LBK3_9ASTR|nr:hypothetical protein E3N88_44809 [Mikania micrantha]
MKESKGRAVVVGGSIAGVSAVHALLSAGWEVVVVEKTTAPPTGSSTGAGLGLDPLAQTIINSWLPHQQSDHLLNIHTLALTIDQVFISAIVSPRFQLTGNSVTIKVSDSMIKKMQEEAEKTWVPELSVRLPVTSKQVLHSRKMGRMKQGLVLADGQVFDPKTATPQECQDLQQKRMPGFNDLTRG